MEDLEQFGPEWEKEMMTMTKAQLVDWIRRLCELNNIEYKGYGGAPEKDQEGYLKGYTRR